MSIGGAKLDPAVLLQHRDFVRSVVRRLIADENTVDDIVQETWLAAMRSPPDKRGVLRAWLARVGRNLALSRLRSEGRRKRREQRAAGPEDVPSAAEVSAKLRLHRQVVEAVESLPEPLQSTVLLRFFENLPPRRIAAAQDVPVATVKSRLRRAFELLRGRLDRQYGGDRGAWCVALLPLAGLPSLSATSGVGVTTAGVLAMKKTLAIAAALLCVLATLLLGVNAMRSPAPDSKRALADVREAAVPQRVPDPVTQTDGDSDEDRVESGEQRPRKGKSRFTGTVAATGQRLPNKPKPYRLAGPADDPETAPLRVLVTDADGHPLPGVTVGTTISRKNVGMGGPSGITDGAGSVLFPEIDPEELIAANAQSANLWRTAMLKLTKGQVTELVIVIPDGVALEGEVTHVEHGPLKQAFLSFSRTEGAYRDSIYVHSDERGRYAATGVPPGTYSITLQYKGIPYNERKQGKLEVVAPGPVTRNFSLGALSLHGRVFDSSGRPTPGASVTVSHPNYVSTTTGPDGTYRFIGLPPGKQSLSVRKPGFATQHVYDTVVVADESQRRDFTLQPAVLMHLHFLDQDDRPVPGEFHFRVKGDNADYSTSVNADHKGYVRYHTLPAGTYRISIQRQGWSSESQEVTIGPAESTVRFVVKRTSTEPPKRLLHGTVRDSATGRPIEGVRIRTQWNTTYSDAQGSYSFDRFPAGSWQLSVEKDGYASLHLQAVERKKDQERKLDFELQQAETLIVRVLDWDGHPVAAKVYLILSAREGGKSTSGHLELDADGRAAFRRVLPGKYRLSAIWSDHGTGRTDVVIGAGETFVEVRLAKNK